MEQEKLEQVLRTQIKQAVPGRLPGREWWERATAAATAGAACKNPRRLNRFRLWTRIRPVWILVPVLLLLVGGAIYGGGSLWQEAVLRHQAAHPSGPGVYVVPAGNVYFDEIPESAIAYGQGIELDITFTNFDTEPRSLLEYPPRITIESRNLSLADRTVRIFPAGSEEILLEPGESRIFTLVWNGQDNRGQTVPYGWYDIRAMVESRRAGDTSSRQGTGGSITRVLVQPESGVRLKSLEVNRTLTVNGVNLTLEKIEAGAMRTSVYTLAVNPDGSGNVTEAISTSAEYRIDEGDWKPAQKAAFGTFNLEEGIRHIWDLDPLSGDARQLTLRIERISEWEGPWEFTIPLDQAAEEP